MILKVTYRKTAHPHDSSGGQGYEETLICDTLNIYDSGETRTPIIIVEVENDIPESKWTRCL